MKIISIFRVYHLRLIAGFGYLLQSLFTCRELLNIGFSDFRKVVLTGGLSNS